MMKKPDKGRPSKYKSKFCQMLIDHMSEGLSFESFAAVIDVNKDTLYAWSSEGNPSFIKEFSEAKKKAFAQNLLWWEKAGKEGLWDKMEFDEKGRKKTYKSLNSTLWIFNMKNRHKWRDRVEADEIADNESGKPQVTIILPDNGRDKK